MNAYKFILLTVGGAVLVSSIQAQSANMAGCGALISTSFKLTIDLGPCAGDGFEINSAAAAITINLNGHKITGSGAGTGLKIGTSNGGVTVTGPGEIEQFETGIDIQDDSVLIYHVNLVENQEGIAIGQSSGVRVVSNTIRAGNKGTIGIGTGNSGTLFIYRNTIEGHSTAGVDLFGETDAVVDENRITGNKVGILAGPPDLVCFKIRGNQVTHSSANGIDVSARSGGARAALATVGACFDIEDNQVNANAGSGIVLERAPALSQVLIQDNIVEHNEGNGISLLGGQGSQVLGNVVLGNETADLSWDPAGSPNSCGQQNIFRTSSASKMPQCP